MPEQLTELPPDDYKQIICSGTPVFIDVYSKSSSSKDIAEAVDKVAGLYDHEQVLFTRCEFTPKSKHPLLTEWGINDGHRVLLAHEGVLKKVIWGKELLPLKGENGAAALQQMVEKGLEKYCNDCTYLNG